MSNCAANHLRPLSLHLGTLPNSNATVSLWLLPQRVAPLCPLRGVIIHCVAGDDNALHKLVTSSEKLLRLARMNGGLAAENRKYLTLPQAALEKRERETELIAYLQYLQ